MRVKVQEMSNRETSNGKVSRCLLEEIRESPGEGLGQGDLVCGGQVLFRCPGFRLCFVTHQSPHQEERFCFYIFIIYFKNTGELPYAPLIIYSRD